jgi:adenylate cyclase class IV
MEITLHYSCAILWNALPSNLKTVKNVDIFKKKYCEEFEDTKGAIRIRISKKN